MIFHFSAQHREYQPNNHTASRTCIAGQRDGRCTDTAHTRSRKHTPLISPSAAGRPKVQWKSDIADIAHSVLPLARQRVQQHGSRKLTVNVRARSHYNSPTPSRARWRSPRRSGQNRAPRCRSWWHPDLLSRPGSQDRFGRHIVAPYELVVKCRPPVLPPILIWQSHLILRSFTGVRGPLCPLVGQ